MLKSNISLSFCESYGFTTIPAYFNLNKLYHINMPAPDLEQYSEDEAFAAHERAQEVEMQARENLVQEYGALHDVTPDVLYGLAEASARERLAWFSAMKHTGMLDLDKVPALERREFDAIESCTTHTMSTDVARALWRVKNVAEAAVLLPKAMGTDSEGLVHSGDKRVDAVVNSDNLQPWHDPQLELDAITYCIERYVPDEMMPRDDIQ